MLQATAKDAITYSNESRLEIHVTTQEGGTSQIVLYGWESVKERGKGRGVKNHFIVLDEVAMYKGFWEGWHEVLRPTLTDTRGEALFISTPKGYNHFYDLHEEEHKDKQYKSFHFTSYDNPHLPKDEIDQARKELSEDRFAQEYLADFRKTEGLVYKDFHRDRHVYYNLPFDSAETIVGVDFGFTNPMAAVRIEKGRDGVYYITEEWVKAQKTTREMIEIVKAWRPHLTYPDPAEPDRIDEMRREGLNTMEVSKEIRPRIDAITQLFRTDRIKIHRDCVNLITELESYHYPEKKPDKDKPELPVHEYCDTINAMEYALYMNAGLMARPSLPPTRETREFREMIKRKKKLKDRPVFIR